MTRNPILCAALAVVLLALRAVPAAAGDDPGIDRDGYIRHWLMLAPILLPEEGQAGDLLLSEQVRGEASLRPSADDRITVGSRELTWRRITARTNFFDFNAILESQNDRAVGYMVTYVECERDIPDVVMAVGSNDHGRIYFNGVDIYAFTEARPLMLDADKGKVTLRKGVNAIVFKVVNEQNSWQGALRLTDRAGSPLKDIRIRTSP